MQESQKYVMVDENKNVIGFYDSKDSPSIPDGAIAISKDDWMGALTSNSNKFDNGFYVEDVVLTSEEISTIALNNRRLAYEKESDPLFMEWQYDQTNKAEKDWRDKVTEIKTRFPI